MPANKSAFFRYLLIDRCLTRKNKKYHSAEDVISYIESNLDERISIRTLQADLKEMKESEVLGFFAPIKYDKLNDGYCYTNSEYSIGRFVKLDNDDYESLELAMSVLEVYKNVPALAHFKYTVEKISNELKIKRMINPESFEKFIFPEEASYVSGIEFIQDIAIAIKNKKVLLVDYIRFGNTKNIEHIFHPYCLKEYNERWYAIGWGKKNNGLLHLALDRIHAIEFFPDLIQKDIDFDANDYFKDYYGVTVNPSLAPETIEISFNTTKGQYIKSRHLHKSQKLLKEDKSECLFEFFLIPNYEFINFLLGCAGEFKIVKPDSLKRTIKDRLQKAIDLNG